MVVQKGKKRPFFKRREDKMTAKEFGVTRSTLKRRLENSVTKRKMEPDAIFLEEEEPVLVQLIL